MKRIAVEVIEDRGFYNFKPWAYEQSWAETRRGARTIRVIEHLMGWDGFRWAVEVDGRAYFVTGTPEPRERASR